MTPPLPLLDEHGIEALRAALDPFTTDAVDDVLGPAGRALLDRGDLTGTARALRGADGPVPLLLRLFTLGTEVPEAPARQAFGSAWTAVLAAGLVEVSAGSARALVDVRPYAETGGPTWWVVSDLGSELRGGDELPRDHVLGIGAASTTLAHATVRRPVGRALDLGTGSGVQALHLSRHASSVVGTDVSSRALRMAATTAALCGVDLDLRVGSLLDPVRGERFDQVVANPPFVVSPGTAGGFDYRDSGLAGDGVSEALIRGIPDVLAPGGVAQLLANWVIPTDVDWQERVGGWLADSGCDAWVWQREIADPAEYVTLWLRDGGLRPGSSQWAPRYDAWLDWFDAHGVAAVGMGLISLWNAGRDAPVVVLEDVPQPVEQPAGPAIAGWHERQAWLARTGDEALLAARLAVAPGVVRGRDDLIDTEAGGWTTRRSVLRQAHGMRWEVEVDDAVAGLVAACDAGATPALALQVLGAATGATDGELAAALTPVLRDLVGRGFLVPGELVPGELAGRAS